MLFENELADALVRGALLAVVALGWVVLLVRVVGLRSFSKMTNFDFVMTVAMGSLVASASQSSSWTAYAQSLAAMAGLFAIQFIAARLRINSKAMRGVLENEPLLLMRDGEFIASALEQSRVARGDLVAKLREANVLELKDVRAAVLETTGDVSVLHGDRLEPVLLEGVRGV
ncbi:DUF421 domain-containing protein [Tsuneonella amylolytica]|uniref:DUF421 domain-containing protein n=1 Tax=Tsuneonella amylolytica TaxID=2338327 RepID=UPI000EAABA43|nr:YetF domain-containing protein [Tsuneonella amylolytica]